MKKEIDVVALILINSKKELFLARRPDTKGKDWEFPGGKVEKSESFKQALKREILEELSIHVEIDFDLGSQAVQYGEKLYRIHFFASRYQHQEIKLTEHIDSGWFSWEQLSSISISPGNWKFIQNSHALADCLKKIS